MKPIGGRKRRFAIRLKRKGIILSNILGLKKGNVIKIDLFSGKNKKISLPNQQGHIVATLAVHEI